MAWIYLAATAESPRLWNHGCSRSPIVRSSDMPKEFSLAGKSKARSPSLQSGTTCGPLKAQTLEALSILCTAVSLAKIFRLQDAEMVWLASEAVYFSRSQESLARFDRHSSSWKMCRTFVQPAPTLSPQQWPAYGMTVDGVCYPLRTWARTTCANDGGCFATPSAADAVGSHGGGQGRSLRTDIFNWKKEMWPTPNVCGGGNPPDGLHKKDNHYVRKSGKKAHLGLDQAVKLFPTPRASDGEKGIRTPEGAKRERERRKNGQDLPTIAGGSLNPRWVEWLMGVPTGATVLEPLVMAWFRPKRGKRLKD